MLPDIVALNRALLPVHAGSVSTGGKGHWQRERQPVASYANKNRDNGNQSAQSSRIRVSFRLAAMATWL